MAKKKILIIDDEASFTKMVKLNLEENRIYDVRIENDGKRSLSAAESFRPDLILLDIMMPKTDGFEVLKTLKNNEKTMNIPVIMLTALSTEQAKLKAVQMYCEDYVSKPISTKELTARMEEVLGRSK
ncbi:MAG: response regulator [Candidatus Omnitrophota bacterium]